MIALELPERYRNVHFGFSPFGPISQGNQFWVLEGFGEPLEYRLEYAIASRSDLGVPPGVGGTLFIGIFNFESRPQQFTVTASVTPVTLEPGVPHEGSIMDSTLGGQYEPGGLLGFVDYKIEVPSGDRLLRISLRNHDSEGDIDLAVRYGQPVEPDEVDFLSIGPQGIEEIVISPQSDPPLRAGTYYIKVINNEASRQRFTLTATLEAAPQPQPPTADFTFSPSSPTTDDTVRFTDRSSDPDGQIVQWRWDFGDGRTSTLQNPTHRYTHAGTYTVTLTVTDDDGLTDTATKAITVREALKPPAAPSGLEATAISTTQIVLRWQDNSDNEDGFRIERRVPGGSWREIDRIGPNKTSYLDRDLQPNTRYCYQVKAFNAAGDSDPSNESCATTEEEAPPPTYEYEGTFTRGQLGQLPVPEEIKVQLPELAQYLERPKTSYQDRVSDALEEVGLRLNEDTGTIFGVPTQAGQFQFLIEVQYQSGKTAAFLWALVTVEESPVLEVTPQRLNLTAQVGDPDPTATFTVRNAGGGTLQWTATARTESGGNWLQLSPTQGSLGAGEAQEVTVTARLAGLTAGTYSAQITVEAPGVGVALVEVTLELQGEGPTPPPEGPLRAEPSELEFQAVVGGPNPEPQTLTLTNTGERPLAWEATIETEGAEGWLRLDFTSGPPLAPGGSVVLTVSVEISGLAAGTYRGTITFSVPQNPDIPKVTVPITLTLEGPPPPPGDLVVLKFIKLEFLQPGDWERTLREGCVVYTNVSAGPSPIRVTLPDGSTQEYEVPSGREVIVCGDVVHIDTRP